MVSDFSALVSVNTFPQSFHEKSYYLFWFKTLSVECVSLMLIEQSKQWVHLFCCNELHINQQKLGSERCSLLLIQADPPSTLTLQELLLRGEFLCILKAKLSQGFLHWKMMKKHPTLSPHKNLNCLQLVFLQDFNLSILSRLSSLVSCSLLLQV